MALKGDRQVVDVDISFFMDEVAERGGIASYSTVGSGAALDQSQALVTYSTTQSGNVPVGLLMNDMVNIDLTRQHINWHKDEMQKGGKVCLLRRGWVVTNMIQGTPVAKSRAYLSNSGFVSPTFTNGLATPFVGEFMTAKDEDGYAKLFVNLPAATVI